MKEVLELITNIKDYGVVWILLALFALIFQRRVITLLTAHQIEMKLASKEIQYVRKLAKAIIEVLVAYFLMIGQTIGLSNMYIEIELSFDHIFIISVIISVVVILWSKMIAIIRKKYPEFAKRNINLLAISIVILMAFLYLLPPLYVSTFININAVSDLQLILDTKTTVVMLLLLLYFSIILVFIFTLSGRIIANEKLREESPMFIKIRGETEETWYIQYRTHENYILLSDNHSIDKSYKVKFIEWNELIKRSIYIENHKTDRHSSNKDAVNIEVNDYSI